LFEGFKEIWPHICPNLDAARTEVERALRQDKIARMAVDDDQNVLGWIGALSDYNGNAWCLYPLAVHSEHREQGIGRALVADLERLVRRSGALTIYLGTDDTANMTSLGGNDLYENLPQKIANIRNLKRHPFEFYKKLGYSIVGVVPDASGLGKPDIFMAKRLK
jgi:aminoglycoside 6'-N-acetyltransferase I